MIDPGLPCRIISTNATHAVCRTSASERLHSGRLQMTFDKGVRNYTGQMYEYVENPTILSAESGVFSQDKVAKGIPAGGIIITVTGTNLNYVQVSFKSTHSPNTPQGSIRKDPSAMLCISVAISC